MVAQGRRRTARRHIFADSCTAAAHVRKAGWIGQKGHPCEQAIRKRPHLPPQERVPPATHRRRNRRKCGADLRPTPVQAFAQGGPACARFAASAHPPDPHGGSRPFSPCQAAPSGRTSSWCTPFCPRIPLAETPAVPWTKPAAPKAHARRQRCSLRAARLNAGTARRNFLKAIRLFLGRVAGNDISPTSGCRTAEWAVLPADVRPARRRTAPRKQMTVMRFKRALIIG